MNPYINDQLQKHKATTAATRYKALNICFNWLIDEGELRKSPMQRMKNPKIPDEPPAVLSEDQLKAILKACEGMEFFDRRDMAIVRLLIDTGLRKSEIANIRIEDIDFDLNVIRIPKAKGGGGKTVVFGYKSGQALDRYLRMRNRIVDKSIPNLWIGKQGVLTADGIAYTVQKRCEMAGLTGVYMHLFRHSFAHYWLSSGGSEQSLQMLGGWKSPLVMKKIWAQ